MAACLMLRHIVCSRNVNGKPRPLEAAPCPGIGMGLCRLTPHALLLAEALAFHWRVLFRSGYVIPWDFRYFHLSLAAILAEAVKHGQLPLWDPLTYCGRPVYANFQMQAFYPPSILAVVVYNLLGSHQLIHVLQWQLLLHVFAAGVFTYHLLGRLGVGRPAALAGAAVFELGGVLAAQVEHLGLVNATAWIPAAWIAVFALKERFSWRRLAALAASLAMTILAGYPALAAVALGSCLLLGGALIAFRLATPRLFCLIAASIGLSLGCAAVQLLPSAELRGLSIAKYRSDYMGKGEYALGAGLPPAALVSLISPNHYGIFDLSHYSGKWEPTVLYLYCGITGLLLAIIAVFVRRDRLTRVFLIMTLASASWMLGRFTPIGKALLFLTPVAIRTVAYPELAAASFMLSMAVLAGLGADWVRQKIKRAAAAYAIALLAAADLILVGSGRPMNTASLRQEPGITNYSFDGSSALLSEVRRLAKAAVPTLRIDTIDDSALWAMGSPLTLVPAAGGDEPMAPARVVQARLAYCDGERWRGFCQVNNPDSPVIDLLNIGYLLSRTPAPEAALAKGRFVKAAAIPGRLVYRNTRVLPRFFLVHAIRTAADEGDAAAILRSKTFDPRKEAVVEGPVSLPQDLNAPGGAVVVVEYGMRRVVLEAESPSEAWLVSSETHYPGWRAWVDGRVEPIYYTNLAFRGLHLAAGRHRVVFYFAPRILWWGAAVSGVFASALLLMSASGTRPPLACLRYRGSQ